MTQKDTMEFWPRTFIRDQMFAWLITNYVPFLLCLSQPRLHMYSTLLLPTGSDKGERKNCYFLWAPALWGKNCSVTWRIISPHFQIIKQTHFNNQKDQREVLSLWTETGTWHSLFTSGQSEGSQRAGQHWLSLVWDRILRLETDNVGIAGPD